MAKDTDPNEVGLALLSPNGVQQFKFRGHTWDAKDIDRVMTGGKNVVAPVYIISQDSGVYKVLKLHPLTDNYMFFANCGDFFNNAKAIVDTMNESELNAEARSDIL